MVTAWDISPYRERTERQVYVADGPIGFATWLELSEKLDTELVKGVMVGKMAAQYPHEWIIIWLIQTFGTFANNQKLGKVLGSRTAVRISDTDGRIPDIVFVRTENLSIIRKDAIHGTPDLIVEVVSENDRPSDLVPLENDYRSIDVPEIVFIDPRRKRVRFVRKVANGYDEFYLTTGQLTFACVPGFAIEVDWLFTDTRPDSFEVVRDLIEAQAQREQEQETK